MSFVSTFSLDELINALYIARLKGNLRYGSRRLVPEAKLKSAKNYLNLKERTLNTF